jgi:hypothetical protein
MKTTEEKNIEEIENEIEQVEKKISSLSSKENRDKIIDNFSNLTRNDGSTNVNGVWSINRKVFPKNSETLPFAKRNDEGKLVSSQKELKKLYLQTFIRRLRHRPIRSDFEYLKSLKEELCSKRLEVSRMRKSEQWTIGNLQKVLACLKDGKSRDSHGLINKIFKRGVGGKDFQI